MNSMTLKHKQGNKLNVLNGKMSENSDSLDF